MRYRYFLHVPGSLIGIGTVILIIVSFTKVSPPATSHPQATPSIIPPLLKQHDTVAIVAPGWWDKDEEVIIRETKKILHGWGLEVVIGASIGARHGQLAGEDPVRLADLQAMLDNPNIRAIFALRGGYGSARIVDSLDFTKFSKHPKWLIGFSDITILHLKLHQLGVVSIHGEMPKHFLDPAYTTSIHSLKVALLEGTAEIISNPHIHNRTGQALAPVVGGNLATICSNIGTPTDLDTQGKILVLEDIGEQLYAVDRMMVQLKRAGKLQRLAGLIIGGMLAMKDSTDMPFGKTIEELIMEHVGAYKYPIAFGMPISHAAPNLAFLHGAIGKLIVTEKSVRLSFGK